MAHEKYFFAGKQPLMHALIPMASCDTTKQSTRVNDVHGTV